MFRFKLVLIAILVFIVCALAQQGNAAPSIPKDVAELNSNLEEVKDEAARWRWHDNADNEDEAADETEAETEAEAEVEVEAVSYTNPCKPVSGTKPSSTSAKSSSTSAKSSSTSAKSSSTSAKSSSTSAKSSSTSAKSATTGTKSSSTSAKSSSTSAKSATSTGRSNSATTGTKSSSTSAKSSTSTGRSNSATTGTKSSSSTSTKSSTSTSASSGSSYGLCDIVPTSVEPLKFLVPLYVYPGSSWDLLVSAASKVDIIAIINPNSGPTSSPDSSYTSYMNKLNNAGVEMVGYVYTSYAGRSISAVKADIDTYASKFPHITGIFFDEASNSASDVSYYSQLYDYVLSKGFVHSILNPGVQPAQGYVDISTSIVIFENYGSSVTSSSYSSFVKCASSSSEKSGYKYKFAGIAHTTSQSNAASYISNFHSKGMGLVYVTDGAGGCCTYNTLVSYFNTEVSSIQSLNS